MDSTTNDIGLAEQSNYNGGRDTSIVINCPNCKTVIWAGYTCKHCIDMPITLQQCKDGGKIVVRVVEDGGGKSHLLSDETKGKGKRGRR